MSDADCLFCKIAAGVIPADIVKRGPDWVAFRDINPQAPTHVLIIPQQHIATLNDVGSEKAELIGRLFLAAKEVA
ncbi:MAG: HIT domain-containing protein, partial [Gemmatimonadales bacterium]